MRQKIKLIVEFEGSAYHGWQVQPNGITVQEVLQSCLQKITKKKTTVISSGRTDAGVHAEAMPAHFITDSKMSEREFMKAFNSLLPHDIVVKDVAFVPMDFDARRSATKKPTAIQFSTGIIRQPCATGGACLFRFPWTFPV